LFAVIVLEDLVEAVLARALEGVADEGRRPAEEDAAKAFFGVDCSPGGGVGGVEFRIDLAAAFYLGRKDFVSWSCLCKRVDGVCLPSQVVLQMRVLD